MTAFDIAMELSSSRHMLSRLRNIFSKIVSDGAGLGGSRSIDLAARASARECGEAHINTRYFDDAEKAMDEQWSGIIWPLIRNADFRNVMELAPGHGRNTARLIEHAGEIHLVDINQTCIDRCQERFKDYGGPCRLHYHVNDGVSLSVIASGSTTFVYSWDAAVHFDREIIQAYVHEFARLLAPGGTGFVHHSNYGEVAPESKWRENPHWRSNMTKALFARYCAEVGLELTEQRLQPWGNVTDCLSMFRKP